MTRHVIRSGVLVLGFTTLLGIGVTTPAAAQTKLKSISDYNKISKYTYTNAGPYTSIYKTSKLKSKAMSTVSKGTHWKIIGKKYTTARVVGYKAKFYKAKLQDPEKGQKKVVGWIDFSELYPIYPKSVKKQDIKFVRKLVGQLPDSEKATKTYLYKALKRVNPKRPYASGNENNLYRIIRILGGAQAADNKTQLSTKGLSLEMRTAILRHENQFDVNYAKASKQYKVFSKEAVLAKINTGSIMNVLETAYEKSDKISPKKAQLRAEKVVKAAKKILKQAKTTKLSKKNLKKIIQLTVQDSIAKKRGKKVSVKELPKITDDGTLKAMDVIKAVLDWLISEDAMQEAFYQTILQNSHSMPMSLVYCVQAEELHNHFKKRLAPMATEYSDYLYKQLIESEHTVLSLSPGSSLLAEGLDPNATEPVSSLTEDIIGEGVGAFFTKLGMDEIARDIAYEYLPSDAYHTISSIGGDVMNLDDVN